MLVGKWMLKGWQEPGVGRGRWGGWPGRRGVGRGRWQWEGGDRDGANEEGETGRGRWRGGNGDGGKVEGERKGKVDLPPTGTPREA